MSFAVLLGAVAAVGCSGAGSVSAERSSLSLDRTSMPATSAEQAQLLVTVRDAEGRPVNDATVSVAMSGEDNFVSDVTKTGRDGETRVLVSSTKVGVKTLTATVVHQGATVTLAETATLTVVPAAAEGVRYVTQPSATKAGVAITPAVTLQLRDRYGNAATDDGTLQLSVRLVRSTGGTVSGGAARPADAGVFTFDALVINRPQSGYALRAELSNGGAAESALFDVTLGDLSSATSTFVAAPVNVIADGSATTTLTLTARDTGGNLLPGQAVTVAVSGTGNTLGAASGTTDTGGEFSTTLASTVAEAKTVTVTLGGVSLTTTVTFIP